MFGPVPEEFYGLVGRVVMTSTLVEDRTLMLLWALDDEPQPTHAGKPFWQLRQLIEQRVDSVAGDLRAEITDVVSRVAAAMDRRNALVHSLWPNPTLGGAGMALEASAQGHAGRFRDRMDAYLRASDD